MNDDEDELKLLIAEQGGIMEDGVLFLKQSMPILSKSDLLNKNKHAVMKFSTGILCFAPESEGQEVPAAESKLKGSSVTMTAKF